jgi:hypothetical protein
MRAARRREGVKMYRVEWTDQKGKKKHDDAILKKTAENYARLLMLAHGYKATIRELK